MKPSLRSNGRFFLVWAALFVAGLLLMKSGTAWGALGVLIVAPTVLTVLLLAWGYLIVQAVKLCGGDPTAGAVGVWIFLSFTFLVLPLLIALDRHHHWTRALGMS
jgi:hypothetical protein